MKRAWEALTLLGFLLMTSEFFVHDRKRLDTYWNSVTARLLAMRLPFGWQLNYPYRSLARELSWRPIAAASGFIWGGILISYLSWSTSEIYDVMAKSIHNLSWDWERIINFILFWLASLFFLGWSLFALTFPGLLILTLHFTERSLKSESAIYFGFQLGAYFTICAQIYKVIFPD